MPHPAVAGDVSGVVVDIPTQAHLYAPIMEQVREARKKDARIGNEIVAEGLIDATGAQFDSQVVSLAVALVISFLLALRLRSEFQDHERSNEKERR